MTPAVLALLGVGARAQEPPAFGVRTPPPVAATLSTAFLPTRNPHVFVREAPGTSHSAGGASLVYRAPGAPPPPAPRFDTVARGSGASIGRPALVDGHLVGWLDPTLSPRATYTLQPPYAAGREADARVSLTPKGAGAR